jgi:hypothetical protein
MRGPCPFLPTTHPLPFPAHHPPPACTPCAPPQVELVLPGDHFVILGTDGLWDRISSAEAVRMAAEVIQRGAQHAAEVLAAESLRRWCADAPLVLSPNVCCRRREAHCTGQGAPALTQMCTYRLPSCTFILT